jgi:hypothetical protein
MSSEFDQRMARIRQLGDDAAKELDAARGVLSPDEFKAFHRHTVDHLNQLVEQIRRQSN